MKYLWTKGEGKWKSVSTNSYFHQFLPSPPPFSPFEVYLESTRPFLLLAVVITIAIIFKLPHWYFVYNNNNNY